MMVRTATPADSCPQSLGSRGFSLVEMAVVLAIVALLLAGLLLPLGAQIDQKNASETQRILEEAREALVGFALINGRLPCPATSTSTGLESPTGGVCTNPHDGFLPARTLSIYPQNPAGFAVDAWGNPIRYAVSNVSSSVFTTVPTGSAGIRYQVQLNGMSAPALQPDLRICTTATDLTGAGTGSAACATGMDITGTTSVAALVFSVGKNFAAAGAASTDEQANWTPAANNLLTSSRDRVFVSRSSTPSGASTGEFDDMVVWLTAPTLFGRMISAGVLP
jgi:prepilin-type N-terminal cleavage/methylation domain-containing protein